MTLLQSATSTAGIPIHTALDAGVSLADLRLLSLHSQHVLLPISLSLDDFRSRKIQEIKEYKQSLNQKIDQLLGKSTLQASDDLESQLGDDWRLIRAYSKSLEAILQAQKQEDIAELINPTTSRVAQWSRLPSKPLEQFYRQLETHLTKALDSPAPVLSRAVLLQTQELVQEVF